MSRFNVREAVAQHGVANIQFTIPMRISHKVGFGIRYTSSNDPEQPVRCRIDEVRGCPRPYRVSEGYKVLLVPVDEKIESFETFYQTDLESLIRENPDLFQVHIGPFTE